MVLHVVLMVVLGQVELLERHNLRDNGAVKDFLFGEFLDVRVRAALLFVVGVENRRAVLRADIRSLAIQFGRIVRHAKKHLQQRLIRHLRRVIGDAHRFGVAGPARAHRFVGRVPDRSARIPRDHIDHALHVLVDALDPPEAAARKHRRPGLRARHTQAGQGDDCSRRSEESTSGSHTRCHPDRSAVVTRIWPRGGCQARGEHHQGIWGRLAMPFSVADAATLGILQFLYSDSQAVRVHWIPCRRSHSTCPIPCIHPLSPITSGVASPPRLTR